MVKLYSSYARSAKKEKVVKKANPGQNVRCDVVVSAEQKKPRNVLQ